MKVGMGEKRSTARPPLGGRGPYYGPSGPDAPGTRRPSFMPEVRLEEWTTADVALMSRALRLARRGQGRTASNPRVGAVLARRGEIVSEGWHRAFGAPHAEAEALRGIRGDTLYVTLEPCCHTGKTPPCTDAVISSGVRRVVIASLDPDRRMRGRGVLLLRRRGIRVEVGLLQRESRDLNRPYFLFKLRGRSHVTLKLAVSADGRMAVGDGASRWITGPKARRLARSWRGRADGVVVGIGTVMADDPHLIAEPRSRRPVRIVLDGRARTPVRSRLLDGAAPTVIVSGPGATASRRRELARRGASLLDIPEGPSGRIDLMAFLRAAARKGWIDLFVEGGRKVADSLARLGAIDRLVLVQAPRLLGGSWSWTSDLGLKAIPSRTDFAAPEARRVGEDLVVTWVSRSSERTIQGWEPAAASRGRV